MAGAAPRGSVSVTARHRNRSCRGQGKGRRLSTALVLAPQAPPWEGLRKLVVDSVSSAHSRRAYAFALDEFFGWYRAGVRPPFSKAVVQEYRSHLEAQGWRLRRS